ncbi:hypothetical protein CYY_007694 [Polysphondylium violaceum]|uniref:Uncharacterized protein n=1 Tax=Polysphondylium violaceum TaxID=133409 RepID=A0A8J4UXV4_9MYCE|nr:hypothetical protein CYY_007694 [Polysphondylium violaceum]
MSIFSTLSSISNPTKSIRNKVSLTSANSKVGSIGANSSQTYIITALGGPTYYYDDGKNDIFFGTLQQFLDTLNK